MDGCEVFFDWNGDFDFEDEKERILLGSVSNTTAGLLVRDVYVPYDAVIGNTIMRVNIEYNNYPGPCDANHSSEWGETEDYTIEISNLDCEGTASGTA